MKIFTDHTLQFQQVFDGAYRYLDHCGEFMDTVRKELNFMHLGVNPSGCDMESSDSSIRLQASIDNIVLTASEPDGPKQLVKTADFCCSAARRIFQPFSVEYNRLTLSTHIRTATLEESFRLSLEYLPGVPQDMSKALDLSPYNQDLNFVFQSGSHRIQVHLYPAAINLPMQERRLPVLGYPKTHGKHLLRREKKLEQAPQQPFYVLNLEISVIENDPVEDSSVQAIYEKVYEYKKRVLKAFER